MSAVLESHSAGKAVVDYGSQSLEEYSSKWDLLMRSGETAVNDTRKREGGVFSVVACRSATFDPLNQIFTGMEIGVGS